MIFKILLVISSIINLSLSWYIYDHFKQYHFNVYNTDYTHLKMELDKISKEIFKIHEVDLIWVYMFHERPDIAWIPTFLNNAAPLYQSAVYYQVREGVPNPIEARQDQPLFSIEKITDTLLGECVGLITKEENEQTQANLPKNRLVLRCPLMNKHGKVVGNFGFTILEYNIGDVEAEMNNYIDILLKYKPKIEGLFFK